MPRRERLPEHLGPFFWDHPFARLSMREDRDLIIRRILCDGSWDAVCWLRKEVGDGELREWLISHDGRGLSPRQLRVWQLVYDLPARKVNRWVQAAKKGVWENR